MNEIKIRKIALKKKERTTPHDEGLSSVKEKEKPKAKTAATTTKTKYEY